MTYLRDQNPRKAWVAGRQIGKSFTVTLEASIMAALGRGPDNVLVSHDQRASRDLLRYVQSWIKWFAELRLVQIKGDLTASEVRLENGCRIVAIPGGRPEAMRGFSGNVWLDEFAHHRDQKETLQAAGPIVTVSGGLIRVISTPFSDSDVFWGLMQNVDGRWDTYTRHRTTIHDAMAAGLRNRLGTTIDLAELHAIVPDPAQFAAEYECVPLSDADSYFPFDLLERAKATPAPTGGSLYGGFDVARSVRGDIAAICEVRRDGDRWGASPTLYAQRGTDFEAMQDVASRLFTGHAWVRMAVDAQGLGMETAERLQKRLGGASRVDAVAMTSQTKADMMTSLRSLLDQGRLALPDDRDLLLDLHSIRRIVGDSTIRYDAERNERGHADRAWALALAVRAAGKGNLQGSFSYSIVNSRRSGGGWKGA